MKIINELTLEELKEASDNAYMSWEAVELLENNLHNGNTYNTSQISPNVLRYAIDQNENYILIALHLGGDVRGNYSDFYAFSYEDGLELIEDKVIFELENESDVEFINKWIEKNSELYEDYIEISIGDFVTIDYGNYVEIGDLCCDNISSDLMYELFSEMYDITNKI